MEIKPETLVKIKTLIEGVADRSPVVDNPNGANYCWYCGASGPGMYPNLTHATDCPYDLALTLRVEMD